MNKLWCYGHLQIMQEQKIFKKIFFKSAILNIIENMRPLWLKKKWKSMQGNGCMRDIIWQKNLFV